MTYVSITAIGGRFGESGHGRRGGPPAYRFDWGAYSGLTLHEVAKDRKVRACVCAHACARARMRACDGMCLLAWMPACMRACVQPCVCADGIGMSASAMA